MRLALQQARLSITAATATLVSASVFAGIIAAPMIIHDRVEIVGDSLILGYSERQESVAWLLAIASGLLIALLFPYVLTKRRMEHASVRWLARYACWFLLALAASTTAWSHQPIKWFVLAGLCALGPTLPSLLQVSDEVCKRLLPPLLLLGWLFPIIAPSYSPWAAVLDFPNMWLSMGVAVMLALPGLLVYSSSVRGQQFGHAWLTVAAVILIVSCAVHMFFASLLVAVLMIADILQRVSADQRLNQPHAIPGVQQSADRFVVLEWTQVAFVLVLSAFIMVGLQLNQGSLRLITFPALIVSVLFTSLLILSWMGPLQKVLTPITRFRILPGADLGLMIALPSLAIGWGVIRGQITTALLLAGLLVLSRLPKWIGVVAMSVWLCLFALPTPAYLHLDDFHDGQILTEVWQYRSGRPLFSSVYPLRMFEFGCAFLADMIKPLTPSWYLLLQRIAKPIGMLGTLLLMFSWPQLFARSREPLAPSFDESPQSRDRSDEKPSSAEPFSREAFVLASFLGLFTYLLAPAAPRYGTLLLLFALLSSAINMTRRPSLVTCCCLGFVSPWLGIDAVLSLAFPVLLWSIADWYWGSNRRVHATPLVSFVGGLLLFTSIIALVEGWESAIAYWQLFVDFARFYPAFYGLRIDLDAMQTNRIFFPVLGSVSGLWAIALLQQSRHAMILAGFLTMVGLRGIGRTDLAHVETILLPLVLAVCYIATVLLRDGCPRMFCLVPGFACFLAVQTPIDLQRSFTYYQEAFRSTDVFGPPTNPSIAQLPADATVWDIDSALDQFLSKRHNPTRHSLAYCIGWPEEQAQALTALKGSPPKRTLWKYHRSNHLIPNPLRYHVITPWLLRNYRPASDMRTLVPISDGPSNAEIARDWERFSGPMPLGWLPATWGTHRKKAMERSAIRVAPLRVERTDRGWNLHLPATIDPKRVNYLRLNLLRINRSPAIAELGFAPSPKLPFLADHKLSFCLAPKLSPHDYVIPIGCWPNWTWQESITGPLLLNGLGGTIFSAELWEWDEHLEFTGGK